MRYVRAGDSSASATTDSRADAYGPVQAAAVKRLRTLLILFLTASGTDPSQAIGLIAGTLASYLQGSWHRPGSICRVQLPSQ